MKALVTGGAGFIGSHLAEALLRRGDQVRVLDAMVPTYDLALKDENLRVLEAAAPAGHLQVVRGDIRDEGLLDRLLPGVDGVFHLAALAGVRESLADPLAYVDVNLRGTQTLLQAMGRAGCRRLVFASSSSVYGAQEQGMFTESAPADRPVSPYAATKRAAELLCHAAVQSQGMHIHCLRFFTVYGPRQRPGMAIAQFVDLARRGEPLPLFGDGASLRDYTFVSDAVAGLLAAMAHLGGYDIVNIGGGHPVTLSDLVAAIAQVVGRPVEVRYLPDQPGDVPRTHADVRRAAERLGWRAQVDLHEGLRRYLEWIDRRPT